MCFEDELWALQCSSGSLQLSVDTGNPQRRRVSTQQFYRPIFPFMFTFPNQVSVFKCCEWTMELGEGGRWWYMRWMVAYLHCSDSDWSWLALCRLLIPPAPTWTWAQEPRRAAPCGSMASLALSACPACWTERFKCKCCLLFGILEALSRSLRRLDPLRNLKTQSLLSLVPAEQTSLWLGFILWYRR